MTADDDIRHVLLSLLQGFYWFDEGLQNYLQARGWPVVTRPQSMVMANLVLGVSRPSDIARNMGVSRQAIHATINQMVELGIVKLADDPTNGRVKIVAPTEMGDELIDRRCSVSFTKVAFEFAVRYSTRMGITISSSSAP